MSRMSRLTGGDLVRTIGNIAALPAVDDALKRSAEAVAAELARAGTETEILKRGDGDYLVVASGQGLFAREFGTVSAPAAPFVGAAIASAVRKGGTR
jgi:hypothetical protein